MWIDRNTVSQGRRKGFVQALALAALVLAAFSIPRGAETSRSSPAQVTEAVAVPAPQPLPAAPPTPEPLLLKPVAAPLAASLNAAIPLSTAPNPAAASHIVRARTAVDQMRSHDCLAQALYYEARSEGESGQRAVAQVVLNRVRHPAYPASICGVVYQGSERATGCQFTFTCDGSLAFAPREPAWGKARRIAAEALAGGVFAPVGYATHYHTGQVLPYWAPKLVKAAVIGSHIFYRWNGGWGRPIAFRQRYAGIEPAPRIRPTANPEAAIAARLASLSKATANHARAAEPDTLPQVTYTALGLPDSQVREAYRNSGAWRRTPGRRPAQQVAQRPHQGSRP